MTTLISIPKSRSPPLIHGFSRMLDPEGDELVSMPPDLARLVLSLENNPELHPTLTQHEFLQASLNRLHSRLLELGVGLTKIEKFVDEGYAEAQRTTVIARVRFARLDLILKEELMDSSSYKGVFIGLKLLMGLLESKGDVDPQQEALWEDIQRLKSDIRDTIRGLYKKVGDLEDAHQ